MEKVEEEEEVRQIEDKMLSWMLEEQKVEGLKMNPVEVVFLQGAGDYF